MKRTSALCILIVAVACSRKGTAEHLAPVPGRDASLHVVEGSGADPQGLHKSEDVTPMPDPKGQVERRGVELVPIDVGDAETQNRRPADEWNKQLSAAEHAEPGPKAVGGSGRIIVSSHRALDQTTLASSRVVTEFLRRALPGVKRCYTHLLSNVPRAQGEMRLRFTVSESGQLVDGSADSWNADLSGCVRELMPKWSFPIPQANGSPARSRFELGLDLQSE